MNQVTSYYAFRYLYVYIKIIIYTVIKTVLWHRSKKQTFDSRLWTDYMRVINLMRKHIVIVTAQYNTATHDVRHHDVG